MRCNGGLDLHARLEPRIWNKKPPTQKNKALNSLNKILNETLICFSFPSFVAKSEIANTPTYLPCSFPPGVKGE